MSSSKHSSLSQRTQLIAVKLLRFLYLWVQKIEGTWWIPHPHPVPGPSKLRLMKNAREIGPLSWHWFTTEGDLRRPGGIQYICLSLLWVQAHLWSWNLFPGKDRIIRGYIIAGAPYSYIARECQTKLIYRSPWLVKSHSTKDSGSIFLILLIRSS